MKAKYIYLMMAGAFLLASCNNDETPLQAGTEPDAPAVNLPEGTFVVDYTASTDGAASRSANGMISSLDYLLYESTDGSTYTLVKNVEIPDISTDTDWPLTRENMTWAQREALKDTLNTSNSYKAVFVANANASLWDEEVLTGVDDNAKFNDARLNLPTQKPFDESNMYFMDVVEVKAPTGGNYVNQKVLLERVINKIEVKLDDEIATDKEGVKNFINTEGWYTELIVPGGAIYNNVKDCMEEIAEGLKVDNSHIWYNANIEILQNDINSESFASEILSIDNEGKSGFKAYHTDFDDKVSDICMSQINNWKSANKVRIKYKDNSRADQIDLKGVTYSSGKGDNYLYELSTNYSFVYYTFGNNTSGDTNKLNLIDTFYFLNVQNEDEKVLVSISGIDFPISDKAGSNYYAIFNCNPYGKYTVSQSKQEPYLLSGFKLKSMLDWSEEHLKVPGRIFDLDEFEEMLNNNSSYKDNGTLESMTITFDDPLITLLPTWRVE